MYTSRTLVVVDTFLIFDMSVIFEDIRDESRKLSEIAPNFGHFFALPNFMGRAFRKFYTRYHPRLTARRLEKFREDTPKPRRYRFEHTEF